MRGIDYSAKPSGISLLALALALAWYLSPQTPAHAATIGVDFVGGSAPGNQGYAGGGPVNAMQSAEVAGVIPQSFWNNAGVGGQSNTNVNAGGSLLAGALVDSTGTPLAGTAISWNANNTFSTIITDNPGNNRLMKGYLDDSTPTNPYATSTTTVTVSNLPAGYTAKGYDLIVYFDGDLNVGSQNRVGQYRVWNGPTNSGTLLGTVFGMDVSGANFSGTFIQASGSSAGAATSGNYIEFTNLHSATFTLDATGMPADVPRAPINAIQIVAVPEPMTVAILGVGSVAFLLRRRRRVEHGIRWNGRACLLLAASCLLLAITGSTALANVFNLPTGETSVTMVPVGNAGNAADPSTSFGSVGYNYHIDKFDVTAGQYTAFLNAVASTSDTYGLYNSAMAPAASDIGCGIVQTPITVGFTYSVSTQDQNFPVNYVSWGDAARFCNWLSNGQPIGAEGNGTTETGSYTLKGATSLAALSAITRNAAADYVIPTENEWYKAAYYNPTGNSYYLYPTQSNSQPSNALSATGANNANYFNNGYTDPTNILTAVGAFAASPSAYGTFDQGGDVFQWNEAVYYGSFRSLRGGAYGDDFGLLQSGFDDYDYPSDESINIGFRVSQVPEPMSAAGLAIGGMVGLLRRQHRRRGVK